MPPQDGMPVVYVRTDVAQADDERLHALFAQNPSIRVDTIPLDQNSWYRYSIYPNNSKGGFQGAIFYKRKNTTAVVVLMGTEKEKRRARNLLKSTQIGFPSRWRRDTAQDAKNSDLSSRFGSEGTLK